MSGTNGLAASIGIRVVLPIPEEWKTSQTKMDGWMSGGLGAVPENRHPCVKYHPAVG